MSIARSKLEYLHLLCTEPLGRNPFWPSGSSEHCTRTSPRLTRLSVLFTRGFSLNNAHRDHPPLVYNTCRVSRIISICCKIEGRLRA